MLTKTSISLSDLPIPHLIKSSKYPSNTLSSSRNQSLISVAICSFLLLPVCNLPPTSLPSNSLNRLSFPVCMSSSFSFSMNVPVRHSSAICAKPFSMALNSVCVRIPAARLARAKAMEPRISCDQKTLSYGSDVLYLTISGSRPSI